MTLGVGLIVLAVVALVWFKNPWMNLMGWIATLSVHYELASDFRLALSDFFVPSLAISLLIGAWAGRKSAPRRRSPLPTLVLIFAAVFIVLGNTMAFVNQGTISRWAWLNKDIGLLDLMLCFFVVIQLIDTQEKLQGAVRVFVLGGSVLNVVALLGGFARYFLGIPNLMMFDQSTVRLAGFMVDPGAYGGFLLCVLLIQLALVCDDSDLLRLPRWVQLTNVALLVVACLMTISRSANLGLFTGLILLVLFYRGKAARQLLMFGSLALLVLGAVFYLQQFSSDVADEFWGSIFRESTLMDRVDINTAAMDMLLKDPTNVVTGIGVGTFLAHADEKLDVPYIIHNDFIWLFVETGVLGLLLFVAVAARSLRNCLLLSKTRGPDRAIAVGLACGIVGTLVWMMGIEGLWHRHVWLLLGLSEVCYRLCPGRSDPVLTALTAGSARLALPRP
jgi:O-antigen ligase